MGYYSLIFDCAACGQPAVANPRLVLSIPARWDAEQRQYVPDPNGNREPVCRSCAARAIQRIADADPSLTSFPALLREPDYLDRAYSEPADEADL